MLLRSVFAIVALCPYTHRPSGFDSLHAEQPWLPNTGMAKLSSEFASLLQSLAGRVLNRRAIGEGAIKKKQKVPRASEHESG